MPGRRCRTPQNILTAHDAGGRSGRTAGRVDGHALFATPELERQQECRKADDRPEHPDGSRRRPDSLLAECGHLTCAGPAGRHENGRHAPPHGKGDQVAEQRHPRWSSRPHQQCDTADPSAEHAPHSAQHRQLCVRRHQVQLVVDQGWHHGALGHGITLLEHQQAEGQREQQQAVEVGGHLPGNEPPTHDRDEDHPAAPTPDAVHQRTDQGGDHSERGDREDQVDGDAPPGRVRIYREEDRAGQGDRDHGVRHGPEHVHPGETGERARRPPGIRA